MKDGFEREYEDELYAEAVGRVKQAGKVSVSLIQRSMRLGFSAACGLIDRMEREGVVSPADTLGRRELLAAEVRADTAPVDNGNIYIFCDAVDPKQGGCLRGAGHNGDHLWSRPLCPVVLPRADTASPIVQIPRSDQEPATITIPYAEYLDLLKRAGQVETAHQEKK